MSITNQRVIFMPHKINIQKQPLEIRLQEISKIEKRNTLLLVPNGIKIIMSTGEAHEFVVWKREKLIELINRTKNK